MNCPRCGAEMKKWFLLGGEHRWECTNCDYKMEG